MQPAKYSLNREISRDFKKYNDHIISTDLQVDKFWNSKLGYNDPQKLVPAKSLLWTEPQKEVPAKSWLWTHLRK